MAYLNNGYSVLPDRSRLDDELYTLVKRLKRTSSVQSSTLLNKAGELIAAGADLDQTSRPRAPLLAVPLGPYMTDEREAVFRMLLEHGANPNTAVSGLSTCIASQLVHYTSLAQIAVSERMLPVICGRLISLLAKHGADLNVETKNGLTPLDIAMCRLWIWEEEFEIQRMAGTEGPYSCQAIGFMLVAHMPFFIKLVDVVIKLGGRPSVWTVAQVQNCRERMVRIYNSCFDARQEHLAQAESSAVETEHRFSFARMNVGEPTSPLVLKTRKRPKL